MQKFVSWWHTIQCQKAHVYMLVLDVSLLPLVGDSVGETCLAVNDEPQSISRPTWYHII